MHEHQIILLVLEAAEREAQRMAGSGQVSADRIENILSPQSIRSTQSIG